MIDLDELIAELREAARESAQGTQVPGSPIMRGGELADRTADALESVRAERNAALDRIENLLKAGEVQHGVIDKCETRIAELEVGIQENVLKANAHLDMEDRALVAEARIAEAAKLHQPSEGIKVPRTFAGEPEHTCRACLAVWPCATIAALDGAPEPDRESQLERAAHELNSFGWTCHGGTHEPGDYDSCEDCQTVCIEVARAAFHAMSGTPHLSADQVWAIAKAEHDYATDTDNVPAFVMPLVDGLRAAGVAFDEQPFIDAGYLLPVEGESNGA